MPVSEAQLRATAKYKAEHYDVVKVNFPKGKKEGSHPDDVCPDPDTPAEPPSYEEIRDEVKNM